MSKSYLTVMVLIDALRRDYLRYAPFMRHLAETSIQGALREGFGFVPRAAYFGGLTVEQSGFTNMFCCDPDRSPFKLAQFMPTIPGQTGLERKLGIRGFVEEEARKSLPPFAKQYVWTSSVPLRALPYLDVVERFAPWDPHVGYTSLFHLMDQKGIPWYQCAWPYSSDLQDSTDEGIIRQTVQDLRPDHRFAYIHLGQLDSVGHEFGPGSAEIKKQTEKTDGLMQSFISFVKTTYDRSDFLIFGDHGMVEVVRCANIETALASLDLKFGVDYVYFLDSTMARFWFYNEPARTLVKETLESLPEGKVLDDSLLEHFHLRGCDRRNAEMIFLADPGVLLLPNYFQDTGHPNKGMHGYDPFYEENKGLFLFHRSETAEAGPTSCGDVDAHELFSMLKDSVLGEGQAIASLSHGQSLEPSGAAQYTVTTDPDATRIVEKHVDIIVSGVLEVVPDAAVILLVGAFGRGEGSLIPKGNALVPVNDYDFLVVSPSDRSAELRCLGEDLAHRIGCSFVDLGWSDGNWENMACTIFSFDLKYGSKVLWGDPNILDRLPDYPPSMIPNFETAQLLTNRIAGMLSSMAFEAKGHGPSFTKDQVYCDNQIMKAYLAIADGYLQGWEAYDCSYRVRRRRFAALGRSFGLHAPLLKNVDAAFEAKLSPRYPLYVDLTAAARTVASDLRAPVVARYNAFTGKNAISLYDAVQDFTRTMNTDTGWTQNDNAFHLCRHAGRFRPDLIDRRLSIRGAVYGALILTYYAYFMQPEESSTVDGAADLLSGILSPSFASSLRSLEMIRSIAVDSWFAVSH